MSNSGIVWLVLGAAAIGAVAVLAKPKQLQLVLTSKSGTWAMDVKVTPTEAKQILDQMNQNAAMKADLKSGSITDLSTGNKIELNAPVSANAA